MQYTEQQSNDVNIPSNYIAPTFYGEAIGILLIAAYVVAKDILSKKSKKDEEREKEENQVIELLKSEIIKKDDAIARLHNEIFLMRKTLDFSGDFAPRVTEKRVEEINKSV